MAAAKQGEAAGLVRDVGNMSSRRCGREEIDRYRYAYAEYVDSVCT